MEVSKTRGVETSSRRRKCRQGRRLLARPRWKRHVPVFLEIPALSGGDSRKISLLEVISKNRQLLSSGGRRRKNVIDEPAVHEIQLKFPVSSCFQILLFARLIPTFIYIIAGGFRDFRLAGVEVGVPRPASPPWRRLGAIPWLYVTLFVFQCRGPGKSSEPCFHCHFCFGCHQNVD